MNNRILVVGSHVNVLDVCACKKSQDVHIRFISSGTILSIISFTLVKDCRFHKASRDCTCDGN